MKKNALMIALIGLVSFGAFAQDKKTWEKPTPEKIAERRTGHMKEKLGLNDEQYKKLYDIHLSEARKHEALAAERREKMKAERAELKKKYAAVLTPEQLKKLEERKGQRADFKRKPGGKHPREGRGDRG
ncbi:MAG: DUF4890 domain-containing protein [Leadbetterella sp.]|nr:DUF4890 domain-containing protein [Leadbetterella sp.]